MMNTIKNKIAKQLNTNNVISFLIYTGILVHFIYPFFYNPLNSLVSDQLRHFENAINPYGSSIMNVLDPPGYELILSSVLRISAKDKFLIALYAGLLSSITPWLWYRWMREFLPTKLRAQLAFIILLWIPNWIRIFSFFMTETVLLPCTGFALWMSWRAKRKKNLSAYLCAGLAWGGAVLCKSNALPIFFIIAVWLIYHEFKSQNKKQVFYKNISAFILFFALIYSCSPLKIWTHIRCFEPLPPGSYNQIYYESNCRRIEIDFKFIDYITGKPGFQHWWFESPTFTSPPFWPISHWIGSRKGSVHTSVDFTKPISLRYEHINMPIENRIKCTLENITFLLFGMTYPADRPGHSKLDDLLVSGRWIWAPSFFYILFRTIKNKELKILPILCISILILFACQQSYITEGRYRIIWEGIAVASLFVSAKRKSITEDIT